VPGHSLLLCCKLLLLRFGHLLARICKLKLLQRVDQWAWPLLGKF